MKTLTIELPDDVAETLETVAAERGDSAAMAAREFIAAGLMPFDLEDLERSFAAPSAGPPIRWTREVREGLLAELRAARGE